MILEFFVTVLIKLQCVLTLFVLVKCLKGEKWIKIRNLDDKENVKLMDDSYNLLLDLVFLILLDLE